MTGLLFFVFVPQSDTITNNYSNGSEVPQWLDYDREENDLQVLLQTGTRKETLEAACDANDSERTEVPPLLPAKRKERASSHAIHKADALHTVDLLPKMRGSFLYIIY